MEKGSVRDGSRGEKVLEHDAQHHFTHAVMIITDGFYGGELLPEEA